MRRPKQKPFLKPLEVKKKERLNFDINYERPSSHPNESEDNENQMVIRVRHEVNSPAQSDVRI